MPFEAFCLDAKVLNVEEDESRLPIRWLAGAQVALRLGQATQRERRDLIRLWAKQAADDSNPDAQGVWQAIAVPRITVRDLTSAAETLLAMANECHAGGAVHLAYCLALNTRLALLDHGPVHVRAKATRKQAELLNTLGFVIEAGDTYSEARDDAVRAGDRVAEAEISATLMHLLPRIAETWASEKAEAERQRVR
jgi:hypothetical protein